MSKLFISYVRDKNRNPVGVMVAFKHNEPDDVLLLVGWSALNPIDSFNKRMGLKIAESRARKYWYGYLSKTANVPVKLIASIGPFVDRAAKYFKMRSPSIEFKTNYKGKIS
jgi:hypothetical protein